MTTTSRRTARRAAPGIALALGGALAALGGGAGPAGAATLIRSCPYTIVAPGTYVLARDLTCPATFEVPAILITADNVRLDLGGNTLTSAADGEGLGVGAAGTEDPGTGETVDPLLGLRVENGTVAGFQVGVRIDTAPGARVAGVTAAGNGADGINVFESPRARVAGNRATGNGEDGFDIGDCDGCVVAGNRATGNDSDGIFVDGGDTGAGARVEGNRATGNYFGISLSGTGSLVRGNTATGNDRDGIFVQQGSTGNRLEGNTATGNDRDQNFNYDLRDSNVFRDPANCVNTWRGNRFVTDNERDGPGAGCIR